MMFTRRHAQTFPSVTLEQGIARLRRVRSKPPSLRNLRPHESPLHSGSERRAAAILASVAFAILLAVCITLYFLSRGSRWELSPLCLLFCPELALTPPALPDPFLTPLPEPRHTLEPKPALRHSSEQYLSYLPHSGFHNQRIALENALVLAYIFNRTLLAPPIRLGEPPLRYRPSNSLRVDVALSTQVGLEHCVHATPIPEECIDFWTHAQVPWDWLVNLAPVTRQHDIRVLSRQDLTDAFLEDMHITSADTFFLNDTTPYQFRFFDQVKSAAQLGQRYSIRVNLPELTEQAGEYRLLQFGTLFGTARLRLSDVVHAKVRRDVRRAMVFTNPILLARADAVRDSNALRGRWGFAAAHLRLGDGVFAGEGATAWNVRHVWWGLVRKLGMSDEDAEVLEALVGGGDNYVRKPPPPLVRDVGALGVLHPLPPPLSTVQRISPACHEVIHPLLCIPLYIATDNPSHPALVLFKRTFPSVYFLANFSQLLDSPPLKARGSSLLVAERFIVPFLDALIASKARVVVGTTGSTFSRFVEDVLWRDYHGWDIVERG